MSMILNIDTTASTALVNIAENGMLLHEEINTLQNDHAAFLQPAIQRLIKKAGIALQELTAVAVCYGPGSYTGIRVGMSSAKGLCYALNKPLIVLDALEVLAKDAIDQNSTGLKTLPVLYGAMVDARRMEVFSAIYNSQLEIISAPAAIILDENSFVNMLLNHHVIFTGSGTAKWKQLCNHPNASFVNVANKGLALSSLSCKKAQHNDFADIAYAEPLYVKEFYDNSKNT